jgi:outer membrane protein OmpA-like peptidoglycan-associated protein
MKIFTSLLIVLLVLLLAGAGYFYRAIHKPMAEDLARFKAGLPEFDRAKAELRKYRDKERQEADQLAWIGPTADSLKKAFENEISQGKAEVTAAGNRLIFNVSEEVLYTPHSVTFAKSSKQALATIAQLLKGIKDKEIYIGNMTQPAPPKGKGRKKIPVMDARTLAARRSIELAKDLVKNGVPEDSLIVQSYPARQPDRGFRIKERKTVITIAPPASAAQQTAAKMESPPAPAAKPAAAPAPAPAPQQPQQPKPIPISPAPPAGR